MCLTDGPRLLTTPTYHVFDMYQAHQGGQSLRTICQADDITFYVQGQERRIPGLMGSASLKNGTLTLSVVNPNATLPVVTSISLQGHQPSHAAVTTLNPSAQNLRGSRDGQTVHCLAVTRRRRVALRLGARIGDRLQHSSVLDATQP